MKCATFRSHALERILRLLFDICRLASAVKHAVTSSAYPPEDMPSVTENRVPPAVIKYCPQHGHKRGL